MTAQAGQLIDLINYFKVNSDSASKPTNPKNARQIKPKQGKLKTRLQPDHDDEQFVQF
jgi:hypothetical protein